MLSNSDLFSSITCPDDNCQRPYCRLKHENIAKDVYSAPNLVSSTRRSFYEEFAPESSTSRISQEGDVGSYGGYYLSSSGQAAYDPFACNYSLSSYPTTTSYEPNSYSTSTYDASELPVPGNYDASGNTVKLRRRNSKDFDDPNKPVLPPDIGDDEILRFGREVKPKEPAVSMKAKKPAPKTLMESQASLSNKKRTEEVNQLTKNIADIDKQIEDLRRNRKREFESNMRKHSINVDALFDVDNDEPPPKKVSRGPTSSSRDSVDSTKALKSSARNPKENDNIFLPQKTKIQSKNEDIIVVAHKPPVPTSKGSIIAHQPTSSFVPIMKRKPLLKDQLENRQKALTNAIPASSTAKPSSNQTLITSFNKNQPRVAHAPKTSTTTPSSILGSPTKPTLRDPHNRKLPSSLRLNILNKLVTEFVKFMPKTEAIDTAQNEEYEMLNKSATRQGYCSSVSGVLRNIRDMANKKPNQKADGISHLDVLKGKHAGEISIGVNRHHKKNAELVSQYTERELYEALFDKYLMTDEALEANGYPLWVDETKKDEVKVKANEYDAKTEIYVDPRNPNRVCCRCKQTYRVKLKPEDVVENSDCVYHWGKFWKKKIQGREWVARYTCCDMAENVPGCSLAKHHVTQMLVSSFFKEFVEAPPRREGYDDRSHKIFALDCEMVYTSLGPAVARLSVVDYRGDKILDELIKPPGDLIDTNYRFSGLEEADVLGAKLDLAGAQERFFEIINRDTILIGHSLESDLKAMRIVHKNVIDTSVLFPHRMGPPAKRALKNLSSEILMEIIQEDVTGHDSAEDARIALRLVLHKLKNE